jgi:folate-dependent phosphoribosylglycinamide formyltransferase PurN
MGYYRVFAESSPKKLVQAHNLHPSMLPQTAGLQAASPQLIRICYVQLVSPLFFYRFGH